MTDPARLADPVPIIGRLSRGTAVILREPDDAARRTLAKRLAPLCRRRKLVLLIAGDARLARLVHADGLHLSEGATRHGSHRWRSWRQPHWIVTAAAHSPTALQCAHRIGADVALLSPIFPTASHPDAAAIGPLRFAAWAGRSPLPVYALGGINVATAHRLIESPAIGIAGISGIATGD